MDWSYDNASPINNGGQWRHIFCDLVGDNFLYQFIDGPTHRAGNKLDLVFCNYPDVINDVNLRSPEKCDFPTDHDISDFNINLNFQRNKPAKRKVYDVMKADFESLNRSLTEMNVEVVSIVIK